MGESVGAAGLKFKWGKKRGLGGDKKEIQFYESFTYDGDEYSLYDCVLVGDQNDPDTGEPFIGKIIKIWENTSKPAKFAKKVKILWFLKPSEIEPYLEGVPDVLANELFLASGEGLGLTNINRLEALGGKCSVLCISKDKRNPQPSQAEIKSTDFVFHRTFDVGSCKVLDTIDNTIAGVDVKFLLNKGGCEKEAVQKVEAGMNANADRLKPNGHSASLVREIEDNSTESSDCRENGFGCKGKSHNQLATKTPTLTEERSNKDSGVQESKAHNEHDPCKASGSRGTHCNGKAQDSEMATKKTTLAEKQSNKHSGVQDGRARSENDPCGASNSRENHCDGKARESEVQKQFTKKTSMPAEASGSRVNHCNGKAQESEVRKQFTKQKSMPAEETDGISREASGSRVNHSDVKKAQANGIKKQLTKQNSMPAEARCDRDSNGLDDRPQKKQKLDCSVSIPDGRNTNMLQSISSGGKKEGESFKRPRDKVTGDEVHLVKKKLNIGVTISERKDAKTATEKGLSKQPSFDGKLLKRSKEKMYADNKESNYQITEVSRKPDAVKPTWYGTLPWEESMRDAEEKGKLVLLQNLDPTYTSAEVEDIVYSALNEQCTARVIECTSATIPHIGQALAIFSSREAAERAVGRLEEGCLLLSNGRPLVAALAKINPPEKPSSFPGHIKLNKLQLRRDMREAVATSHCSQENNIERDMAMEWCLHQARYQQTFEEVFKRQSAEVKSLRMNFKPKPPKLP